MIKMAEEKPFTISFTELFKKPKQKRAASAIRRIKDFASKRFHFSRESVFLSKALNSAVWADGREKIPRKLKLKAVQENNSLRIYLMQEKIEVKKEKKPAKKEESKKSEEEEKKQAELERKKKEKKEMERAAEKAAIKRKVS